MKKFIKILLIIAAVIAAIAAVFFVLNKINEGIMEKYVDSFDRVYTDKGLVPQYDEDGAPYFETDGEFKVMHLTDIHIGGGILSHGKDKKALNAVAAMITAERPDLVIVTGDISFAVPWAGTLNNAYAHEMFKALMEELGVYWTVTFGNHDSEAYDFYGRSDVARMYMDDDLEYCLFSSAEGVSGEGNHVINVKNSLGLITESFYMIDSHSYMEDDPFGLKWDYDYIKEDQIEWYRSSIEKYRLKNAEIINGMDESYRDLYLSLANPKSLMFMHIPLLEVRMAYNEYAQAGNSDTDSVVYHGGTVGEDGLVVFSSETDTELYEAVLEMGSTEAIFFGHDHLNNFVLEYNGVKLSYGYSIDYFAYFGIDTQGAQRGCTVIICSESDESIITHENYYQDKYVPIYEKESVDMS